VLLLVCASSLACDEYCRDECQSNYEECVVEARGDDTKVDRCDSTRAQCTGGCADTPMDANDARH
jgi:hypothetical protein